MARIISEVVSSNIDHNNLADLTVGDDHTQYALLAGRATPQQLAFGTASGASTGYLTSTAHATKGKYFLNSAGTITIDELNGRIGIGVASPDSSIELGAGGNIKLQDGQAIIWGAGGGTDFQIAYSSSHTLQWFTNTTLAMTVDINGILTLNKTTGAFIPSKLTTTQRNALTASNGMIIYNTTLEKFQGYENGAWTSFI